MATLSDSIRSIGARGGPAGGLANALQQRAALAQQAAAQGPAAQPYVGAYSANNAMAPQQQAMPASQAAPYDQMGQMARQMGPAMGGQPDYTQLARQVNSLMPNVTNLMRR